MRFFKPRLQKLITPVKEAGISVCLHSCGYIYELIYDIKEIGTDVIWPQIALYDSAEWARHLKDIGLATVIHIDRANIMTNGRPEDVTKAVEDAAYIFRPQYGGSWFYLETDNSFPYENIEALVNAIVKYR